MWVRNPHTPLHGRASSKTFDSTQIFKSQLTHGPRELFDTLRNARWLTVPTGYAGFWLRAPFIEEVG